MFPDLAQPPSHRRWTSGTDADVMGGPSEASDPVSPCPAVPKGPLWVRLDLTPEQAASDPGSLRLRGGGHGILRLR